MIASCLSPCCQPLSLFPDMVRMGDVNEATVLHNLRMRFGEDLIYTNIGATCVLEECALTSCKREPSLCRLCRLHPRVHQPLCTHPRAVHKGRNDGAPQPALWRHLTATRLPGMLNSPPWMMDWLSRSVSCPRLCRSPLRPTTACEATLRTRPSSSLGSQARARLRRQRSA